MKFLVESKLEVMIQTGCQANPNHRFLVITSTNRFPSHGNHFSPDLTISSPHIRHIYNFDLLTTHNSDHLSILVELGRSFEINFPEPPHQTFTNLKNADWDSFTREADESFQFHKILISSIKHHIPNMTLHFTKRLIFERDALRSTSPTDLPTCILYTNLTHKSTTTLQTPANKNGPKPLNVAPTSVIQISYGA